MKKSPYEIFLMECPELAAKFNELVQVQHSIKGLDQKTKQLINIAIQTANKNPTGVKMHAMMAKTEGIKKRRSNKCCYNESSSFGSFKCP